MVQIKTFVLPRHEEEMNAFIRDHHIIAENMQVLESGLAVVPYDDDPAETEALQVYRGMGGQIGKAVSDIYLSKTVLLKLRKQATTGGDQKRREAEQQIAAHERAIEHNIETIRNIMPEYANFDVSINEVLYGKKDS